MKRIILQFHMLKANDWLECEEDDPASRAAASLSDQKERNLHRQKELLTNL